MKKRHSILALTLAGVTLFALTACDLGIGGSGTGSPSGSNPVPGGGSNPTAVTYHGIQSTESVYAVGAVTTAKLLSAMPAASATSLSVLLAEDPQAPDTTDPQTPDTNPEEQNPDVQNPDVTNPDVQNPDVQNPDVQNPDAQNPDVQNPDPQNPDYGLPDAGSEGVDKAQDAAGEFNKYFNMLDDFLDKAATETIVEQNVSEDPLLKDYAYKLTVQGKDIEGKDTVHVVYYTETAGERVENTERDDDEVTFIVEQRFTLTGLVDMGTAEDGSVRYSYMTGSRVERSETEDGETETTATLVMKTSAAEGDTQNYVEMRHVSESEQEGNESETENTFTYTVYSGGRVAERTEIEFEAEEEHGEKETEYSVRFLTGASRGSYEIERETKNGATWIAVEYSIDGVRGKFVIVQQEDGSYDYKFSKDSADDRNFRDFDD